LGIGSIVNNAWNIEGGNRDCDSLRVEQVWVEPVRRSRAAMTIGVIADFQKSPLILSD
jgi:hypothetical protein